MTVQRNATVLPPHITRILAYDRRTDGRHLTLSSDPFLLRGRSSRQVLAWRRIEADR